VNLIHHFDGFFRSPLSRDKNAQSNVEAPPTVVFAGFNRTIETGKRMRLDKAKAQFYGQNHEP
jgi:hypothetical protein